MCEQNSSPSEPRFYFRNQASQHAFLRLQIELLRKTDKPCVFDRALRSILSQMGTPDSQQSLKLDMFHESFSALAGVVCKMPRNRKQAILQLLQLLAHLCSPITRANTAPEAVCEFFVRSRDVYDTHATSHTPLSRDICSALASLWQQQMSQMQICMYCKLRRADIVLLPCGHRTCAECSIFESRCYACLCPIVERQLSCVLHQCVPSAK